MGKETAGLANAEGRERCVGGSTCGRLGHDLGYCHKKEGTAICIEATTAESCI
jgi:hypothetical protein